MSAPLALKRHDIIQFVETYSQNNESFVHLGIPACENLVIGHGCNCFHNMGKGIAHVIANKWPEALWADKTHSTRGDRVKMGLWTSHTYQPYNTLQRFTIVNLYTQYNYGKYQDQFDYKNFQQCMVNYSETFGDNKNFLHVFPKIGSLRAKGNWRRISEIMNKYLDVQYIIVDLDIYEKQ